MKFTFVLLIPINVVVHRQKDVATLEVERYLYLITDDLLDFLGQLSCGVFWEIPPLEHGWDELCDSLLFPNFSWSWMWLRFSNETQHRVAGDIHFWLLLLIKFAWSSQEYDPQEESVQSNCSVRPPSSFPEEFGSDFAPWWNLTGPVQTSIFRRTRWNGRVHSSWRALSSTCNNSWRFSTLLDCLKTDGYQDRRPAWQIFHTHS